jgi:hypothetical protein
LGFASAVDDQIVDREAFATNFICNICDDPVFKKRKRINELFDLNKQSNIHQGMTTQQILLWVNSLLKQFSLKIQSNFQAGRRLQIGGPE